MSQKEKTRFPKPKLAIGSLVLIDGERWQVKKYHKIGNDWEIMLQSRLSGVHRSVPCQSLEAYL